MRRQSAPLAGSFSYLSRVVVPIAFADTTRCCPAQAKAARTDNDSALKHLRENIVEWERLEAELRARLEIEKKQFQREIDELNRKLEEEKRNFQLRHDRETQVCGLTTQPALSFVTLLHCSNAVKTAGSSRAAGQ